MKDARGRRWYLVIVLAIVTAGSHAALVAHYNFNQENGSSYLYDSTLPATDIPVTSTASALYVDGLAGLGLAGDFFNAGGYYSSTSTGHAELDFGTGDFTISGWFKAGNTTYTSDQGFIIQNALSSSGGGYWLYLGMPNKSYSNKLRFSVRGTTSITVESDNTVTDNVWHWYAVVVNNQNLTMYVDGVLQASTVAYGTGTSATSTTNFRIGRYYDGYADEMRFYTDALNADAIYAEDGKTLTGGSLYDLWQVPEPATLILLGFGALTVIRKKILENRYKHNTRSVCLIFS